MKDIIRVALMQIRPLENMQGNIKNGLIACEKAKRNGAHIALFPEMFSCGYTLYDSPEKMKSAAICDNSEYVNAFCLKAAELDMAIGFTLLRKTDGLPQNSFFLADRHGNIVLKYAKVHTCDFDKEKFLQPGDDFCVTELDTGEQKVKVGAMICYDREFPESARILMLKGAEIILVPNACPMEINRISQLRGRAYENMVGIATANYPAGVPDCNGHSSAFDGMAYIEGVTDRMGRDTLITLASEEEGIYYADFPISQMRVYRESEVHGNAYRHPSKYHLLVSEDVQEPFIREDSRR